VPGQQVARPATSGADAPAAAIAGIQPRDFAARIGFLASDALGGRDTPSPGLEAAAAYIASEFHRFGLETAGDPGSFIQRYPFTPRGAPEGTVHQVPNVAGLLRGSDPQLRNTYVVFSAHIDHVGSNCRGTTPADSICNGADDDASGTSAIIELAEAFASLPAAPRRSIIFLGVSGEEKGLLGSRHYADNPTVPIDSIVANVNIDMIGRNDPDSVVVIGKDYSSLGPLLEQVNARHPELGMTTSDDLWPDERFFFRSDHFNFARRDVPAIFFFTGTHPDYHAASDHADRIDLDKITRITRLIFHYASAIANDPDRPQWDPAGLEEVRRLTTQGR
ncbi:MAG: M28 family peptidase, partial [Gemmatimonadota bacterium]